MKQREAVYNAVCQVTGEHNFDEAVSLTAEQRKSANETITQGIANGEVDFSDEAKAKYSTPEKIGTYVSGLISNWLRKDKRLNGNVTYVPANPGSRAGQGDPQLRELRKLKRMHEGTQQGEEIQSYIDDRLIALQALKTKSIKIDASQIPEELQGLIS